MDRIDRGRHGGILHRQADNLLGAAPSPSPSRSVRHGSKAGILSTEFGTAERVIGGLLDVVTQRSNCGLGVARDDGPLHRTRMVSEYRRDFGNASRSDPRTGFCFRGRSSVAAKVVFTARIPSSKFVPVPPLPLKSRSEAITGTGVVAGQCGCCVGGVT